MRKRTMTPELIVVILVFASVILVLLKAVIERRKEIVYCHEIATSPSGCGCMFGLLLLVVIALVVAVLLDAGGIRKHVPPEWLQKCDEWLANLKAHK
jgi:hypothetical protein